MNADAELLNYVYQNSQMGIDTTSRLIDMNDNKDFKDYLAELIQDYIKINDTARDLLQSKGYEEKDINSFKEITTYFIINLKTITDKSSSNMAKIIIEGANKGIIEIAERINRFEGMVDEDIIKLMKKYQKHEENNVKEIKIFL